MTRTGQAASQPASSESSAKSDAPRGRKPGGAHRLRRQLGARSIVLVGMMGAGKSSVGRRLAQRLGLPFLDADHEIERAAGQSVSDIFENYGEAEFRSGERRVIARLLGDGPIVLATGGGAFLDAETRDQVRTAGISIWLRADPEVLMKRVRRRNTRPLLRTPDPEGTLRRLLSEREPVYETADITIESRDGPHEAVVDAIVSAIERRLSRRRRGRSGRPRGQPAT